MATGPDGSDDPGLAHIRDTLSDIRAVRAGRCTSRTAEVLHGWGARMPVGGE